MQSEGQSLEVLSHSGLAYTRHRSLQPNQYFGVPFQGSKMRPPDPSRSARSITVQFPSESKRHQLKLTEIKISFLPFLTTLETNCLASEFSSSFFCFAPSSIGYTTPEPQLCFNFQNPVCMTQASLQTENVCTASGSTNDDLRKSQCIIKHKPPAFNTHDLRNCGKILKGDLYFTLLLHPANTVKAIN